MPQSGPRAAGACADGAGSGVGKPDCAGSGGGKPPPYSRRIFMDKFSIFIKAYSKKGLFMIKAASENL